MYLKQAHNRIFERRFFLIQKLMLVNIVRSAVIPRSNSQVFIVKAGPGDNIGFFFTGETNFENIKYEHVGNIKFSVSSNGRNIFTSENYRMPIEKTNHKNRKNSYLAMLLMYIKRNDGNTVKKFMMDDKNFIFRLSFTFNGVPFEYKPEVYKTRKHKDLSGLRIKNGNNFYIDSYKHRKLKKIVGAAAFSVDKNRILKYIGSSIFGELCCGMTSLVKTFKEKNQIKFVIVAFSDENILYTIPCELDSLK
jgi:hypothetical protein